MLPVTIIIPVYCTTAESVGWFDECLASAVATKAQVMVWDDASPKSKEVAAICVKYGVYYHTGHINRGPSHARNMAAGLADTELILPLDCDDTIRADAVELLYAKWLEKPGTPVFPDLVKVFPDGSQVDHRLVDWSCKAQQEILGIASVNILHEKRQWAAIGGWDGALTANHLYEDSEYNARLLGAYCAVNLHSTLIYYRQHSDSRLASSRTKANREAGSMLQRIRGYEMACCGKKAKTVSAKSVQTTGGQFNMSTSDLPELEESTGKVLVQYVGGQGKGTHTYRGPVTGQAYKVVYGAFLYVDATDAREEVSAGTSLFIRKHQAAKPQLKVNKPEPKKEEVEEEVVVEPKEPRVAPQRKPAK